MFVVGGGYCCCGGDCVDVGFSFWFVGFACRFGFAFAFVEDPATRVVASTGSVAVHISKVSGPAAFERTSDKLPAV